MVAIAQEAPSPAPDVVVTGQRPRGTAIDTLAPIATLDAEMIRMLGATDLRTVVERLKGLATSSAGSEPVMLLNGRRVADDRDVYTLPYEAIERTEILPEEDAPRFGFPPTVRIMNFVTKKNFRALATNQLSGTSTEGGGETTYSELTSTRIAKDKRMSVQASYFRQNPVWQHQRAIVPDASVPFAIPGNVAGIDGRSIDPRLDALAGQPVTIAPLPGDAARRGDLAAYAAAANRPAVTDIGRYRTIVSRTDKVALDGTIAGPISAKTSASLNLSMTAERIAGANGLASAALTVPGSNPTLPFGDEVTLYRYFPDVMLRQSSTNLTLHGGATLNGGIGRWAWNATATYDDVRSTGRAEQGVALNALQAAIDAGGDPSQPLDPVSAHAHLVGRSLTHAATFVGKAVANGPLMTLPAGPLQLMVSADAARLASSGEQPGLRAARLDLTRTTHGGSVAVSVPVAAASQGVLPVLGRLTLNGMIGVADVSDFGRLTSYNYGVTWSPLPKLQLTASTDDTRTAPDMAALTAATLLTPNVPIFDYATGRDERVILVTGGNPALSPERRRITRLGVSLAPFAGREMRFALTYVDMHDRNRAYGLGTTALLQNAFPDRFVRDADGRLVQVDARSVNVAEERKRKLQLTTNLQAPLGPRPPEGKSDAPPKPRPSLFVSLTSTLRLSDIAIVRPGIAPIDMLDGGTLNGTGGRPRWEVEGTVGGSYGPFNIGTFSRLQGPTRVRSDLAQADLTFSGLAWVVLYSGLDLENVVKRSWTKRMSLNVTVENLFNDRIRVRDRQGATPDALQAAYLDPIGRSVRLGVRKLF